MIKVKKRILCFLFGTILIVSCLYAERVHSRIAESVIRLHILANSNSKQDQLKKLEVRNFVLENYGKELASDNKTEALEKIYKNLPSMLKEIKEFSGQNVKITISESDFPTKVYKNLKFPEGRYLALKIVLGKGQGENWWCVMYPPLCFETLSTVSDEKRLKEILPESEYEMLTQNKATVLYKFKTVELWNKAKKLLK